MRNRTRPLRHRFLLGIVVAVMMAGQTGVASARNGPVALITTPESLDLLRSLGAPLLRAAGIKPDSVHFHIVRKATLNAMALPGNNIVLHSGLILAVRDRDALAAVLAHEIGHLSAGHHVQLEAAKKNLSVRTMVAFVAGVAAGALTGDGNVTQAAIMGGSAASQLTFLETRRNKERQADRLAMRYLTTSGFDPQGMARFMEQLAREQQLTHMPPPYFLSHPPSSQRLVESWQDGGSTREPTQRTPHQTQRQRADNLRLAWVQAALKPQTHDDLMTVLSQFRQRLARHPENSADRYGLAITERYMGELPAAMKNLNILLETHKNNPYLLREKGMVYLEKGQPDKAEKIFRAALKHQPRITNAELRYRLAFSLHERGKWERASRILRQLTLEHPFVAGYVYLLGVTEGKQGRLGASHLALARHFRLIREKTMARWHYEEALRHFSDGDAGKAIAREEMKRLTQIP